MAFLLLFFSLTQSLSPSFLFLCFQINLLYPWHFSYLPLKILDLLSPCSSMPLSFFISIIYAWHSSFFLILHQFIFIQYMTFIVSIFLNPIITVHDSYIYLSTLDSLSFVSLLSDNLFAVNGMYPIFPS